MIRNYNEQTTQDPQRTMRQRLAEVITPDAEGMMGTLITLGCGYLAVRYGYDVMTASSEALAASTNDIDVLKFSGSLVGVTVGGTAILDGRHRFRQQAQ